MQRRILWFVVAVAVATALVLASTSPWAADDDPPTAADGPPGDDRQSASTAPADPDDEHTAGSGTPGVESDSDATLDADTTIDDDDATLEGPPPPDDALRANVTQLADGDSFEVEWIDPRPPSVRRDEVRMRGINAPEGFACFGTEARIILDELIADQPVLIDVIESELDEFGRAIANVWSADGVFLNLAQVRLGAALALRDGGPHQWSIWSAGEAARDEGRGLWTACVGEADIAIVGLRHDAAGRDDLNQNDEWIDIANLGSASADLTGWSIRDESTRNRFHFPDGIVFPAGSEIRIRSGCGDPTAFDLFWCAEDPVWNNSGDTAFLVDADGRFVDEWSYSG